MGAVPTTQTCVGYWVGYTACSVWDLKNRKREGKGRKDPRVRVFLPEHPNADKRGRVYEHRAVLENKLGRLLSADEVGHHRNEIGDDNREENLEAMLWNDHASHHSGQRPRNEVTASCPQCGVTIVREKRNAKGAKLFCSTSCSTSYYTIAQSRKNTTQHGTSSMYRSGCRCEECRAYQYARVKRWRKKQRAVGK